MSNGTKIFAAIGVVAIVGALAFKFLVADKSPGGAPQQTRGVQR